MENEVKEPAKKYNYISPDEYLAIERASDEKQENNNWRLTEFKELTDSFPIATIGLTLLLSDLYEDVHF